jgi:hypothetical protein
MDHRDPQYKRQYDYMSERIRLMSEYIDSLEVLLKNGQWNEDYLLTQIDRAHLDIAAIQSEWFIQA